MFRQSTASVPILVILAMVLAEMATDAFAPSLPDLKEAFGCSSLWTQMTIGGYLVGLALSGLVVGPISDVVGRRTFMITGLLIFGVAGLSCYWITEVHVLSAVRFLQGLGGGTVATVGMAALTDLYTGRRRAQMINLAIMTLALSPGLAPVIGGIVADLHDWRATFVLFAVLALILDVILILSFAETRPRTVTSWSQARHISAYVQLLKQRRFLGYSLVHALILAGLWVEYSGMPFIFIDQLNVEPHFYGLYCAGGVSCLILGTMLNHRWVLKYSLSRLIALGFAITLCGHVCLLLMTFLAVQSPAVIQLSLGFKAFGCALVFSNSMTRALQVMPRRAGVSTAVIGALEMILSAGCIALVSHFFPSQLTVLNVVTLALTAAALVLFMALQRHKFRKYFKWLPRDEVRLASSNHVAASEDNQESSERKMSL